MIPRSGSAHARTRVLDLHRNGFELQPHLAMPPAIDANEGFLLRLFLRAASLGARTSNVTSRTPAEPGRVCSAG